MGWDGRLVWQSRWTALDAALLLHSARAEVMMCMGWLQKPLIPCFLPVVVAPRHHVGCPPPPPLVFQFSKRDSLEAQAVV
jgi:hypothetical protein